MGKRMARVLCTLKVPVKYSTDIGETITSLIARINMVSFIGKTNLE